MWGLKKIKIECKNWKAKEKWEEKQRRIKWRKKNCATKAKKKRKKCTKDITSKKKKKWERCHKKKQLLEKQKSIMQTRGLKKVDKSPKGPKKRLQKSPPSVPLLLKMAE